MFGIKAGAVFLLIVCCATSVFAQETKEAEFAGSFYPADPGELAVMIDRLLASADAPAGTGRVCGLIVPHAGYAYSGRTAAQAYRLVQGSPVRTVVIFASAHRSGFKGAAVYPHGYLRTPLGDVEIDGDFVKALQGKAAELFFDKGVFSGEHPLEVQLPFLQRALGSFKVVFVLMGDCDLKACSSIARAFAHVIGERQDVLIIASSDMYHGYDWREAEIADAMTLGALRSMKPDMFYGELRAGRAQMCGGLPAVVAMMLCGRGADGAAVDVLSNTNSAAVTKNNKVGDWTVGYAACQIRGGKEKAMLTKDERKKLLEIARASIAAYLKTGKKMDIDAPASAVLGRPTGAFVTLRMNGELRGCIGNLAGETPLYLAVRDMAVESAVGDPRFTPLKLPELDKVEIEISALSPLERVNSAEDIELGKHGVIVRRGFRSGVYLPQVASETGWGKEEFLSSLCAHKAGLSPDAWKQKDTELYVFSAEVFSENDF